MNLTNTSNRELNAWGIKIPPGKTQHVPDRDWGKNLFVRLGWLRIGDVSEEQDIEEAEIIESTDTYSIGSKKKGWCEILLNGTVVKKLREKDALAYVEKMNGHNR